MKRVVPVLAVLGVLLLTVWGGGRLWLLASLPPPGGRAPVAGLRDSVAILFDSLAVPHIVAAHELDAYAALGYVHARDRMFQMDLLRHAALGRLAELFGARAIAADRELRELEMGRIARARAARMTPATRRAAAAYASGVNAWLAGERRAVEFRLLRHTPERWTPEHSLAIGVLQAHDLAFSGDELELAALAERLGWEKARELIPVYADSMPVIVGGWGMGDGGRVIGGRGTRDEGGVGARPNPAAPIGLRRRRERPAPAASNAWVVSGARTASGKPIVANDPHLVLRAPALWYLAGLHAPGLDVVGVTIPGLPAVVLGHTRHVAWGFTNAMVDDVDYVLEELSPDGRRYRTRGSWAPVEVVPETIHVRGAAPEIYERRRTRNGPAVTVDAPTDGAHAVVMRWVAQDGGRDELAALHGWARARGQADFLAAARLFRSPEQNVVYADRDGNIGYVLAGSVPVRRVGEGVLPVRGAGGPPWTRYLADAELPAVTNPPSGRIVTANNRIVGPGFPHHITFHWDHAYRARRILELLAADSALTAAALAQGQLDQLDLFARAAKRHAARAALERRRPDLADRLRAWDGTMAPDAVEPTIFWTWYRHLLRLTYADESPDFRPTAPLHRWLAAGGSDWFDDQRTAARESLAVLAEWALDSTLADAPFAPWGDAHPTIMEHPLGAIPVLGRLVGFNVGPLPTGGSNHTVNVSLSRRMQAPFTSGYGPSMRHVVDLGRVDDAGGFVIPTGQSGHPVSRHYRDQTALWREGRLWILPVEVARVRAVDTLRLVP